jgi:branched-chain amino acid transport system ATP-binding protein
MLYALCHFLNNLDDLVKSKNWDGQVKSSIKGIRDDGVTILLVEQDADLAFAVADRVYVLEHGKVALQGVPEDLMKNPYVKEIYLGIA